MIKLYHKRWPLWLVLTIAILWCGLAIYAWNRDGFVEVSDYIVAAQLLVFLVGSIHEMFVPKYIITDSAIRQNWPWGKTVQTEKITRVDEFKHFVRLFEGPRSTRFQISVLETDSKARFEQWLDNVKSRHVLGNEQTA